MAATGKGTLLAREPEGNQARGAQEETRPGQTRAQRATLLEQAKEAAAKLAELMTKLSDSGSPTHPDEAGLGDQLKIAAATLQETGPNRKLAPAPKDAERTVAVGVLRTENRQQGHNGNAK